jgi:hypothetical protein
MNTINLNDKELIIQLGGASVLAKRLNLSKQRVHNWISRGIPPSIKLQYPHIFLKKKKNA